MYKAALLCLTVVIAHLDVRPAGWLDRAAAYYKQRFLEDLDRFAPVKISATLERAPPGYKDSNLWNYDNVFHLLNLIKESEAAAPVRHALRRVLRPSRRFMSRHRSYKYYPSLVKKELGQFYYDETDTDTDDSSDSEKYTTKIPDDDDVIVVSNAVEARLPSARISVKLLRNILEARALAARVMPSTQRSTIPWKPMTTKPAGDITTTETTEKHDNGTSEITTATHGNVTIETTTANHENGTTVTKKKE